MIRNTYKSTWGATFAIMLPSTEPEKRGMPIPIGTGFFVSEDGWFVTAAHVVTANGKSNGPVRTDIGDGWLTKEPSLEWNSPQGAPFCKSAVVEYVEPETDFALLRVDFDANRTRDWLQGRSGFPCLQVSSRELDVGEPVYAFGYPLAQSVAYAAGGSVIGMFTLCPRVTSAVVAAARESAGAIASPNDPRKYVLDKALNYGNSGGPIVATETGHVHALCSSFQPVFVPQPYLRNPNGEALQVMIPSLYGVVSSLGNPTILGKLRKCGIPTSET